MHNNFKAISISHKTAPVEVREQLALNIDETRELLQYIGEFYELRDVLVLSTCNRTEIYYASEQDHSEELVKLIALKKATSFNEELAGRFHFMVDHNESVEHLFRVAVGLESQIIGDMQITNQVKNAYQLSADADLAGPFLHRLMHTTFFANKRVVQESGFRDGAASTSYATLNLIEHITVAMQKPKVLILGLGNVGRDLCMNLADHRNFQNHHITLVNRTHETACELAETCGFEAVEWGSLSEHLATADVVVSAVNAPQPIITVDQLAALNILSFKYCIDLSVPRSMEENIDSVNGIVLYNLDDIQTRTDQALKQRLAAIPQVEAITKEAIVGFHDWGEEMSVNPTINKLKNALEQIRKNEMARYLKNASLEEKLMVEKVTKSMMQKVIKLPVVQLKAACKRGEAETLIDLLNDLFDLEKVPASKNTE